jgi:hypothetical protein
MNPLQRLILDRMHERGWSAKDVEDRGVKHATLWRYMNPVQLRQPPRRQVLEQLAMALDLPFEKVQRAAFETVDASLAADGVTTIRGDDISDELRVLTGRMEQMTDEARARWLAMALELTKAYLPPDAQPSKGAK